MSYFRKIVYEKGDALYWRFGHFVTALVAVLVILGSVALSLSMIFTKKGK